MTFGTAAGSFEAVAVWPGARGESPAFSAAPGHREGNRKSITGYPALDFYNRRRGTESRGRSRPKAGRRKSSTGYPVRDFWNRRRKFRKSCGLARAPGRYPAVSPALGSSWEEPKVKHRVSREGLSITNRRRAAEIRGISGPKAGRRKSSTGYPVLDFWNRRRKFRHGRGLAQAPGLDPAVSPALGAPRGELKVQHRLPGLYFSNRRRAAEIRERSEPRPRDESPSTGTRGVTF